MSRAVRTVWDVWRGTRDRSFAQSSYSVYILVMVGFVTLAPVGRGLWLLATDASLAAVLASPSAAPVAGLVVASAWVLALVTARFRGPVVFAPFLAHILTGGPIPHRSAFARPVRRALVAGAVAGAVAGGVLVLAWTALGAATVAGGLATVAAGTACGVITAVLWLAGQSLGDRTVAASAGVVTMMAVLALTLPSSWPFTPIGWVMALYATIGGMGASLALIGAALLSLAVIPRLMALLSPETVMTQSRQWANARLHAGTLDLSASAATYQPLPRRGRHRFAVRAAPALSLTVLLRGAHAAVRTPARLATSILVLVGCGTLIALSATALPQAWLLAAAAGVIAYAAVGAVSDGIGHIVDSASSLPMYGAGDETMLLTHTLFPLLVAGLTLALGATGVAVFTPPSAWTALAPAIPLALGSVGLRVMNALKPPLPLALLTPIPTPAGDAAALNRVLWATDALILAALTGLAVSVTASNPLPVVALVATISTITVRRWKRR